MKISKRSLLYFMVFFISLGCLYVIFGYTEGFLAVMPGDRCGVDLKGCPNERKCMNGICYSTDKPCLGKNELPVYP